MVELITPFIDQEPTTTLPGLATAYMETKNLKEQSYADITNILTAPASTILD